VICWIYLYRSCCPLTDIYCSRPTFSSAATCGH